MKVKNAAGEETDVEFMWAGFGNRGGSLVTDVGTKLCDPERADADLTNAEQLKGKIAVGLFDIEYYILHISFILHHTYYILRFSNVEQLKGKIPVGLSFV
jgi:hypothetical protein